MCVYIYTFIVYMDTSRTWIIHLQQQRRSCKYFCTNEISRARKKNQTKNSTFSNSKKKKITIIITTNKTILCRPPSCKHLFFFFTFSRNIDDHGVADFAFLASPALKSPRSRRPRNTKREMLVTYTRCRLSTGILTFYPRSTLLFPCPVNRPSWCRITRGGGFFFFLTPNDRDHRRVSSLPVSRGAGERLHFKLSSKILVGNFVFFSKILCGFSPPHKRIRFNVVRNILPSKYTTNNSIQRQRVLNVMEYGDFLNILLLNLLSKSKNGV